MNLFYGVTVQLMS